MLAPAGLARRFKETQTQTGSIASQRGLSDDVGRLSAAPILPTRPRTPRVQNQRTDFELCCTTAPDSTPELRPERPAHRDFCFSERQPISRVESSDGKALPACGQMFDVVFFSRPRSKPWNPTNLHSLRGSPVCGKSACLFRDYIIRHPNFGRYGTHANEDEFCY